MKAKFDGLPEAEVREAEYQAGRREALQELLEEVEDMYFGHTSEEITEGMESARDRIIDRIKSKLKGE